jgi:hypothetical protein
MYFDETFSIKNRAQHLTPRFRCVASTLLGPSDTFCSVTVSAIAQTAPALRVAERRKRETLCAIFMEIKKKKNKHKG